MKTHIKRSLSLFLSLVMIITSLSVAFQAWADNIQDARDEKVTSVEEQIKDFYGNHKSNLYLTGTDDASTASKDWQEKSLTQSTRQCPLCRQAKNFSLMLPTMHTGFIL